MLLGLSDLGEGPNPIEVGQHFAAGQAALDAMRVSIGLEPLVFKDTRLSPVQRAQQVASKITPLGWLAIAGAGFLTARKLGWV